MDNCFKKILLTIVFVLSTTVCVLGQQTVSPEDAEIRKYREDLQVLADKPPSSGTIVVTLRRKLRDLLIEKRGALKKEVRDYSRPNASNELQAYVSSLQEELRGIDSEVETLDGQLAGATVPDSAAVVAPPANPALEPAPKPGNTPAPSEAKNQFDEVVKSFTPEKLEAATAPPELMESKAASVSCSTLVNSDRPDRFSIFDQAICFWARSISERKALVAGSGIRLSQDKGNLLSVLIPKLLKAKSSESFVSFVTEAQEERTDQQVGAGPSGSGTTSLVTKGGVPAALGFAVENGAALETRSGTTITFRTNPAGLIDLFAKKGFISGFRNDENEKSMGFLRKTSIGLSFDTDRGPQPGTFTGNREQLSAVSVRYEFINERDPRHKKYEADWERLTATVGEEFARTTWATTKLIQNFGTTGKPLEEMRDPALQAWLVQTNTQLAAAGTDLDRLAEIIRTRVDALPVNLVTSETVDAVESFAIAFETYQTGKNNLLEKIARGKIFTLEYTNKRGASAPDTSNFNFIAATGAGSRISLTSNGSFTFFNKQQDGITPTSPRPNRIRDFQFAGQLNAPFRIGDGQLDFWFSGRYERLLADASTPTGLIMPGTKGDVAVGQFGLNIPIKSLGMIFPVSVTFSNRTELVKEKEVRGNFGFTFNWDTIWSKIKPF